MTNSISEGKFSALHIAFVLSVFITSIVLITSIFFLFGVSITWWNFALGVVVTIVFTFHNGSINIDMKEKIKLLGLCFMLVTTFIMLSVTFFDNTWDGAGYHKQAIGQLREGWNPLAKSALEYNILSQSTPYAVQNHLGYAEQYPKATWYFAAVIYSITNNIESGKAYNLIMSLVLFCILYDYLRFKFSAKWKVIIVSTLAVLNPISIAQFQSYYLDGFACNIVMCIIILFCIIFDDEYGGDNKTLIIISFCLVVLGCNTKFSIMLFIASLCFIFFLLLLIFRKKATHLDVTPKNVFIGLSITAAVSIGVVGFSPYITNFYRYGNPFHGFFGLVGYNMEGSGAISGANNIQMFFASLFGRMSHGEYETLGELLKLPFTFSLRELGFYYYVDTRLGGMGILFSGIFIISAITLIIYFFMSRKTHKLPMKCFYVFMVVLFIEMLILPATFQARYIGFIYIIPIAALIILLQNIKTWKMNARLNSFVFITMVFVLVTSILMNIAPFFKVIHHRALESHNTAITLSRLGEQSNKETPVRLVLSHPHFAGMYYNLKDFGVEYEIIEEVMWDAVSVMYDEGYNHTYFNWIIYKEPNERGHSIY